MKVHLKICFLVSCRSFGIAVFSCAALLISVDLQAQNVFVSNLNGDIYEYTPAGARSTFATGLAGPEGLAFDSNGNLFVADFSVGQVTKITPNGQESIFAELLGGGLTGLAVNSADDVFVANMNNGTIDEITPAGVSSLFASGLSSPTALAFNSAGDLFEADSGSGNVNEFTAAGQNTFASGLGHPYGLAFDRSGNLFVASEPASAGLYEVTPQGTVTQFYSNNSIHPKGIAFNQDGNLFATDSVTLDIDQFTPSGAESTFTLDPGQPEYLVFQPVPEPSTPILLGAGIVAICFLKLRPKTQAGA